MSITQCARALALTACLGLMAPGMAMSANFNDTASGTQTMTGTAKSKPAKTKQAKQTAAKKAPTKKAPAKAATAKAAPTKKAKKQRAAPQDTSVRGG